MNAPPISASRTWKVLNGAASQQDRLLGAPSPETVQVDGRSAQQLLAFPSRYGALIQFYDLQDKVDGDWSAFFASDPAVAHAAHAALDLPDIERRLRAVLGRARDAPSQGARAVALRQAFGTIARLLSILDRSLPGGGEIEAQLARFARTERQDGVAEPLRHLHQLFSDPQDGQGEQDRLVDILEDVATALIAELGRGADAAQGDAAASLNATGHAPQAAVWNAFVTLFDQARQELNRFPARLLDFYYGEILKQDHRAAEPDAVFLTFTLVQGAAWASVPKGALFSAGTDPQGQPVNYAAAASLLVGPAQVSGLSVHRLTYDANGQEVDQKLPTGVLSGTVAMDAGGVTAPFPLFGATRPGSFGALTMLPASLGFVVASPALLMCGGTRTVQITVSAAPPPVATLSALGGRPSADGMALSEAAVSTALAKVMGPAFALYYSTAGGWMAVQDPSVTPGPQGAGRAASVVFTFTLPPDAPPVMPSAAKLAAGASAPTLPVSTYPDLTDRAAVVAQLRADPAEALQPGAPESPFAILSALDVATITVAVTVKDLQPATLSGPNGPIDPGQSFPLFGLAPAQGASLDIAAPELFAKQLNSLSLSIHWVGLPVTTTGFTGYYQAYTLNADGQTSSAPLFDNSSFKAALCVVSPGLWAVDSTQPLYLFQTDGSSGPGPAPAAPVAPVSLLVAPGVTPQPVPNYYNPASSRLRLTIAEPAYAFGNALYPLNLVAASAANAAALRTAGQDAAAKRGGGTAAPTATPLVPAGTDATPHLAEAASVNATAPDERYHAALEAPVTKAVSALNGHAAAALRSTVPASGAPPATQTTLLKSLDAALAGRPTPGGWSWLGWVRGLFSHVDPAAVTAKLKAWLAANAGGVIGEVAGAALRLAEAALSAAEALLTARSAAAKQTPDAARPAMAAAIRQAQAATGSATKPTAPAVVLPNPPWLPMASSVTLSYTAGTTVAADPAPPPALGMMAMAVGASPAPAPGPHDAFLHLLPFRQVVAPAAGAPAAVRAGASRRPGSLMLLAASPAPEPSQPLLPPVAGQAALYVDLTEPADQISLLFVMTAGPDGWSTKPSTVEWQKQIDSGWYAIEVLSDTTNGLRNTGIVSLQIAPVEDAAAAATLGGSAVPQARPSQTLRAVLVEGLDRTPLVTSVTANATMAAWAGPGGAAKLGTPLPPLTIKQSVAPIAGLGTITQPMQSIGGYPPAVGPPFQMWMAERLRHKGFGIDSWDYARLVLAAVPSLWQAAVVPATDEATGKSAPGQVWLVAVAGPTTPNITDPTVPAVDPGVLAEIGQVLRGVISPFAVLTVTNPPYLRLTVAAELVLVDADTSAFWIARLQDELVRWLSPWPDDTLGPRPADYYTRQAVADFVRRRPYVLGITHLRVVPERDPGAGGWHYLTSAAQHLLTGKAHTELAHAPAPSTPPTARQPA